MSFKSIRLGCDAAGDSYTNYLNCDPVDGFVNCPRCGKRVKLRAYRNESRKTRIPAHYRGRENAK